MAKIKIVGDGVLARIFEDDKEITNVTSLKLDMSPLCVPVLTLEIAAIDSEITLDNVWVKRIGSPGQEESRNGLKHFFGRFFK